LEAFEGTMLLKTRVLAESVGRASETLAESEDKSEDESENKPCSGRGRGRARRGGEGRGVEWW
jgi:hypothetical protein